MSRHSARVDIPERCSAAARSVKLSVNRLEQFRNQPEFARTEFLRESRLTRMVSRTPEERQRKLPGDRIISVRETALPIGRTIPVRTRGSVAQSVFALVIRARP
jgi:hypothetical protein